MRNQHTEGEIWLVMLLAFVVLGCCFATNTPEALVVFALAAVYLGVAEWIQDEDRLPPRNRPVSAGLILLGIGFLVWYFSGGRASLHPILNLQKFIETLAAKSAAP